MKIEWHCTGCGRLLQTERPKALPPIYQSTQAIAQMLANGGIYVLDQKALSFQPELPPAPDRLLHKIGRVRLFKSDGAHSRKYVCSIESEPEQLLPNTMPRSIRKPRLFYGNTPEECFRAARYVYWKVKRRKGRGIMAMRIWNFGLHGLMPLNQPQRNAWQGPVTVAHEKPKPDNTAGLYATKLEQEHFESALGGTAGLEHCFVYGIVELYGRVITHKHGYRAERAVIRKLFIHAPGVVAPFLESQYQCEVVVIPQGESLWTLTRSKK